jgi:glycosyltransferase involved in cell wall biosynthesis
LSSNTPLISVCIPCFNSEKYVGETINCLLNQTYKNLEVIVVDDGSTDGSVPILKRIADNRFKYVIQPNKGAAAARNAACQLSSGEYIKFMDADDLLNPEFIETQLLKIIERPGCIASAKWGRFFAEDASDFKLAPEKIWRDLPGIDWLVSSLVDSGTNMVQPGIFLIPRNIIEMAGPWNEELSLIDDFEFMARIIANSKYVLFCEEAVLMYRSGLGNNLSAKKTGKHMQSAFDSVRLGTQKILATRNDAQSRLACANTYQRWAYQFYPYHRDLCNKMEREIKLLGGSSINLGGGKMTHLLCGLTGWKMAKRLKMFLKGQEDL